MLDAHGDVLQCPELLDRLASVGMKEAEEADLELDGRVVPQEKPLGHRLRFDDGH